MSESMIESARRAAREYIDHQIAVIKSESPYYIWDVCPWAYQLVKDDPENQDHLFELICEELEHVSISYMLQGSSAHDAQVARARAEVAWHVERVVQAQNLYAGALDRLIALDPSAIGG